MAEILAETATTSGTDKNTKRRGELELARIVACCCIIVIHLNFAYNVQYPVGSFLRILSKGCATTVFFMITGAFLKASQPFTAQVERLIVKNVIPFLVVTPLILQFWPAMAEQIPFAACFSQWNVTVGGFFTMLFAMNVDAITSPHGYPTPNGGIYHLWFMFALYKCYFFLPILKPLLVDGSASEAAKRYALAMGGIVFLLVPTVKLCVPADNMLAKLPEIQLEPFLWLWVMLVGNHLYFRLRPPTAAAPFGRRTGAVCLLFYLSAGAFLYFLTMRHALDADGIHADDRLLERGFIPLFAANIAIFVFFASLRIGSEKAGDAIRRAANKVFYIYLFHVPVVKVFQMHIFPDLDHYAAADKLLQLAVVFAACYGLASLCRRVERGFGKITARHPAKDALDMGQETVQAPSCQSPKT